MTDGQFLAYMLGAGVLSIALLSGLALHWRTRCKLLTARDIVVSSFSVASLPYTFTGLLFVLLYFAFNVPERWDENAKDYNPPVVLVEGLAFLLVGIGTLYRRGLACGVAIVFFSSGVFLSIRWVGVNLPSPPSECLLIGLICSYASIATAGLAFRIGAWRWP